MSGPQCCENPPTLNPGSGSGHVEKVGGLDAYVSGSPDSKLGVLLVSDIFGYQAPNLRALADKVAASGFYVVVPDYFYGDPYDPSNQDRPVPVWIEDHSYVPSSSPYHNFLIHSQLLLFQPCSQVRLGVVFLFCCFDRFHLNQFIILFSQDKGFEDTKPVLEAIKNKGITAIGAAGMCWGAKVVVELSKRELIQAAVLLHPGFVVVDDIKNVKTPIAILGAEFDFVSPPALVKQFEEILACKPEVNSYVKIYPNVSHGWTIRYSLDEPEAVKAAEEAHREMLDWFMTYVK